MRTVEEIKEMDHEDLKDELTYLEDKIKYQYHNITDLEYLRMLKREFNNRI